MPTLKDKWILASLTDRVPPELQGKAPAELTSGEIVAFINGLDPAEARRYASDHNSGDRFKTRVAEAFEKYRLETQASEREFRLPKLKKKDGTGPMDYQYVMRMTGQEYSELVYDNDGKPRRGIREALAEIIAAERHRKAS